MILTTGGRAIGATSTRSNPRSCAAASASSTGITPSCSPPGPITRTGLMRICRLTRTRFSRSFVDSGRTSFRKMKKGTPEYRMSQHCRRAPGGDAAGRGLGPGHTARLCGLRVGEVRSPLARRELYPPKQRVSTRLDRRRWSDVTQIERLGALLQACSRDLRIVLENEEPIPRHCLA